MMSGAAMVVQTLKDLGVKHVFGYPGGAVLDIYDALFAQDDVEHVLVDTSRQRRTWLMVMRVLLGSRVQY